MMNEKENFNIENKETKKFSDLTIFTTTLYGLDKTSEVRQKLAEKFLSNCNKLHVNCVVVDGGSNQAFLDKIKSFKNITLLVEPHVSMGESRRGALRTAINIYKTPYFLWVEPEKNDLIKEETLLEMIKRLRKKNADIVVPQRIALDTYPRFQAWAEKRANERATKIMDLTKDKSFDLWFGPKMFNLAGAKYFVDYKSELDKWDSIVVPVVNAYKDGLRVVSVEVDYKYDSSQKENEEGDKSKKRKIIEQYTGMLRELKDPYWYKDKPLEDNDQK